MEDVTDRSIDLLDNVLLIEELVNENEQLLELLEELEKENEQTDRLIDLLGSIDRSSRGEAYDL